MGLWVISKRQFDVTRLKRSLSSKLSLRIIKGALKVQKNGKYLFEEIVDRYCDGTLTGNLKIKYFPVIKLLNVVRHSFGYSEEEFKIGLQLKSTKKIFANALSSLDRYGFNTPQGFADPVMIVWNFTNNCNLRCKHCYQSAYAMSPEERRANELHLEDRLKVVDIIAERNIPSLFFSGGEPLIEDDFWPVAERAKKKGLYLSIATNGTLINKKMAKRIADIGFGYVQVSIDSADPEVHDEIRGIPGVWERAVRGIENLIDAGVTTCIAYTHMKSTHNQIEGIFKLRKELGAYKVVIYNYIPVGRAGFEEDPTPEQREELHKIMYDKLEAGRHVIATTDPTMGVYCRMHQANSILLAHYADLKVKELGVIADIVGGCGAGRAYGALQPNGDFTPCVYMPNTTVGNILKQPFDEIWNEHPLMKMFKTREGITCNKCGAENEPVCGGCRARAYEYFGSFKSPDPGCIFNKELYYDFMEKYKKGEEYELKEKQPEVKEVVWNLQKK